MHLYNKLTFQRWQLDNIENSIIAKIEVVDGILSSLTQPLLVTPTISYDK